MAWSWIYEGAADAPPPVDASQEFPTRADAETWIGESWAELLAQGIEQVSLREDDHVVYGPMSLRPA